MTSEDLHRHSILENGIEMSAEGTPEQRLTHYTEARIQALQERNWPQYNMIGKRIMEILDDRTRGRLL